MTDQDQSGDDPRFDDPAYDDIRDLLGSLRVSEPVPDAVVTRLDETLAALTADRRETAPVEREPAPVVPLRRRSRMAPRLLVAAAAVVVVGAGGIGLSEVLGTQSDDLATSATAESDSGGASPDFGPAPSAPTPLTTTPQNSPPGNLLGAEGDRAASVLPEFTTAGFATQAEAFDDTLVRLASGGAFADSDGSLDSSGTAAPRDEAGGDASPGETTDSPTRKDLSTVERQRAYARFSATAKAACPGPVGLAATVVPITFDGEPAALAVYLENDGAQLYEAWSCDGRTMLATTVVQR